jgi:hypothetical protein
VFARGFEQFNGRQSVVGLVGDQRKGFAGVGLGFFTSAALDQQLGKAVMGKGVTRIGSDGVSKGFFGGLALAKRARGHGLGDQEAGFVRIFLEVLADQGQTFFASTFL